LQKFFSAGASPCPTGQKNLITVKKSLTNHYAGGIIYVEKAKPQTVMPIDQLFNNNRPGATGGYFAFTAKIIITMIINMQKKSKKLLTTQPYYGTINLLMNKLFFFDVD